MEALCSFETSVFFRTTPRYDRNIVLFNNYINFIVVEFNLERWDSSGNNVTGRTLPEKRDSVANQWVFITGSVTVGA
jgi:hypothetical protein